MPTRYQDGAAGSHGFGTPYRTCLEVSGRGCRISRFGTPDRTRLRGIRTELQVLTGKDLRSNMHMSYELGPQSEHAYGAAGFHWLRLQSEHAYGAAIICLFFFPQNLGAGIPWGLD